MEGRHFGIGAILTRWRSVSEEGREGASISKMSRCQRAGERFGGYGVLARTAYRLMGAFRGSLAWVKNGVGVAESLSPLSSSSSSLSHRFIEFHPEGKRDEGKSPENGSGGFPPKIGNRSPSARASREADRFVDLASESHPLSSYSNDGVLSVTVVRKSEVSLSRSTADDQVHFCLLALLCLSSRASNQQEGTNQVAVK